MKRIASAIVLVIVVAICGPRVPHVLAAGGFGQAPPDKTVGPTLNVSVVMEGPRQPSDPTERLFTLSVRKSHHLQAAIFTGTSNYVFGCLQPGFPSLQASTEQRFLGFLQNWAPIEVLDPVIGPFGDPTRAVIIAVDDVSCTPVGDKEYLHFTGRLKFAL